MRPLLSAIACFLLLTPTLMAENWPQWRGPHFDGISSETGVPSEWSANKNILWKVPLPGLGGSTPAVWGDKIFLTAQDKDKLLGICIRTDGHELWRESLGGSTPLSRGDEGNGASASPSTDGTHVWFFAGSGELACCDFQGKEVWKINVQDRYGKFKIQFGIHSTPVLYQDRLYLRSCTTTASL